MTVTVASGYLRNRTRGKQSKRFLTGKLRINFAKAFPAVAVSNLFFRDLAANHCISGDKSVEQ